MAFWDIDLTTRMGAQTAASQGGFACYVFAGLGAIGTAFTMMNNPIMGPTFILQLILAGILLSIYCIAGYRMNHGMGAIWGIVAAILLTLSLVFSLIGSLLSFSFMSIGGLVVNAVLLIVLIQGVRGAWALRPGEYFEEDETEVFQ